MRRALMLAGMCLSAFLVSMAAVVGFSGPGRAANAATGHDASEPAFTQTETITRSFLSGGQETVSDTRTVTLNVSQTSNLQGRQEIGVSWSGAHPTGDIVPDPNSAAGEYEEYPFVLLECRGTASGATQVTPETCWTQDANSRYQGGFSYQPYQLDQYATTAGADVVGEPSSLPTAAQDPYCQSDTTGGNGTPVRYWVPWLAANGTVYDGGEAGSCGEPPEATDGQATALPSNETYGVTGLDGTGNAEFDVFDSTQNATLGCSATVTCSLVAVPIMGISCDADVVPAPDATDLANCEAGGAVPAGSLAVGSPPDFPYNLTVTGQLWWSPSNWNNRITVPLTFAPTPDSCPVVSSNNVVDVYGSELMLQATSQWEPYFCLGEASPTFTFNHVSEGEPEARNEVATGAAEAAFTSDAQPQGYGKPVVNAPVAVTGFTVSFSIDDVNGDPISTLKLTPLLLAKLLTNSYPVFGSDQANPALGGNPLNITDDPEFEALNPNVPQLGVGSFAAAELTSLSEDSDVMEALTTYINDDPSARAWLNGTSSGEPAVCNSQGTYAAGATDACPAMVVNPAYKGISLPVEQWPLLSTWVSTEYDQNPQVQYCLQSSPEPFDTLLAAPLGDLSDISEAMQFHRANSTTTCTPDAPSEPNTLSAAGIQSAGTYFQLGLTPLADDARYDLQTAELQTTPGTFVAPTNTSLQAATNLLQPNTATETWVIPYGQFETAAGAAAYPGTLVVYAAIPTQGLPAADATDYAALLNFAAAAGQETGDGVGQLPAGYLPLTAADGLGGLNAYTLASAVDVAAQNGLVPALTSSSSPASSPPAGYTSTAPSTPSSPGTFTATGAYGESPYSSTSGLSVTSAQAAEKAAAAQAASAKVLLVQLPPIADAALWTKDMSVGLLLGLAFLVALAVLTTFLLGRQRRRW
jgi:hypothetical protein